jgi:mannose/cellobiose epimerase-like protein (N-acyl-D-glucosamine 2-epimerase family)
MASWVEAETMSFTAVLYNAIGDAKYQQWDDNIWQYSWMPIIGHIVDHQYGFGLGS